MATSIVQSRVASRRQSWRLVGQVLTHALMLALSAVMVLPFVAMFLTSIMTFAQAYTFPPDLIPRPLYLANYTEALALRPFHIYLLNSLGVALTITLFRL